MTSKHSYQVFELITTITNCIIFLKIPGILLSQLISYELLCELLCLSILVDLRMLPKVVERIVKNFHRNLIE